MNLRPPSNPSHAENVLAWWPNARWPDHDPWPAYDIGLLTEWRRLRISVWGIAAALGRTEAAVEAKLKELGL